MAGTGYVASLAMRQVARVSLARPSGRGGPSRTRRPQHGLQQGSSAILKLSKTEAGNLQGTAERFQHL